MCLFPNFGVLIEVLGELNILYYNLRDFTVFNVSQIVKCVLTSSFLK